MAKSKSRNFKCVFGGKNLVSLNQNQEIDKGIKQVKSFETIEFKCFFFLFK